MANYVAALERDFPRTVKQAMAGLLPPRAPIPAVVERVTTDMAAEPKAVGISAFRELVGVRLGRRPRRRRCAAAGGQLRAASPPTSRPTGATARGSPSIALEGTGHWPMFEVPDAFDAALAEWVDELTTGKQ